jgi:hypothetical protein
MRKNLFFLLPSLGLHMLLFLITPQMFSTQEERFQTLVFFEPTERKNNVSAKVPQGDEVQKPTDFLQQPEPLPEKPAQPKPAVPPKTQPKKLPEQGKKKPTPNKKSVTEESVAPESDTDTANIEIPSEEKPENKESLANTQTPAGEPFEYALYVTGKGRRLMSTQAVSDFRLSNNTTVRINFKIDKNGVPYDITIPPVPRDIELMLRDFARGMRFSAVLYNEPDSVEVKVTLTVR